MDRGRICPSEIPDYSLVRFQLAISHMHVNYTQFDRGPVILFSIRVAGRVSPVLVGQQPAVFWVI